MCLNKDAVVVKPQLARNQGARVGEDGTVLITTDLLQFTEVTSTASQIVYTLSTASSVGQLKKSDAVLTVGSTFTKDDIDNERLTYTTVAANYLATFSAHR